MPVAVALIIGVVVLAISLIGLIRALLLLIPFYAYVGIAVYLLWRFRRKEAERVMAMKREAERQRSFNEQEMRAWRASLEEERQNPSRPVD